MKVLVKEQPQRFQQQQPHHQQQQQHQQSQQHLQNQRTMEKGKKFLKLFDSYMSIKDIFEENW